MPDKQPDDVLTLAEAASYLRVHEEEVLRLAEHRDIPAQRIGGEWRFLKRALGHWLTYGPRFCRDFPPWFFDHPFLEDLLLAIEKRLLQPMAPEKPERGSKEAVRRHVGILKEENDLEELLARLSSIRKSKLSATAVRTLAKRAVTLRS
ncbi:MAG TPA: helix-turn-helix domain-containing protein [Gemmataceae bacterium]|nr:helix-turn-helix domain-containing protein [Gemmataceae bacterium]